MTQICNQKVAGSIPAVGTKPLPPTFRCAECGRDNEMLKTIILIALTMIATGAFAQTPATPPLALDVAQQRARFARDQLNSADEKVKAAEKKDKAAQRRLEDAKADADKNTKQLQDAQADLAKARERHDQAYQELKRSHDAMQESNKPQ